MLNTLLDQAATIFKSDEGKTLKFLGNTATCKFTPDDRGWQFYELVATAGHPVPLHRHAWDEISYLLEGEVDLQIGNQTVRATPGYFVNLPAGVAHAFNVRSPQAKFLVGTSNAIAFHFMEDMAQAEQMQQLTPERVMVIAQKHHVQVIS